MKTIVFNRPNRAPIPRSDEERDGLDQAVCSERGAHELRGRAEPLRKPVDEEGLHDEPAGERVQGDQPGEANDGTARGSESPSAAFRLGANLYILGEAAHESHAHHGDDRVDDEPRRSAASDGRAARGASGPLAASAPAAPTRAATALYRPNA